MDENIDRYQELAIAIIQQACKDWRTMCIHPQAPEEEFNRLRRFFRSTECEIYCGSVDPIEILDRLEKERMNGINKKVPNRTRG